MTDTPTADPVRIPFRARTALFTRRLRLRLARWLLRPLHCEPAGTASLQLAVRRLAETLSWIDSSGELRRRTHAATKVAQRVSEIALLVHAAAKAGDPTLEAHELAQLFHDHRVLSLSKHQRRKLLRAA